MISGQSCAINFFGDCRHHRRNFMAAIVGMIRDLELIICRNYKNISIKIIF